MRPIPKWIIEELENDPRMKKCLACKRPPQKIEWNHALIYAGKQINEPYAIQPLCMRCHMLDNSGRPTPYAKAICTANAIILGRGHLQKHYPKRDWDKEKQQAEYEIKRLLIEGNI